MSFADEIYAAGNRQIGVEIRAAKIWIGRRIIGEADDVVEAGVEIVGGQLDAVGSQVLFEAGPPAFARFGLEIRIPGEARIGAETLVETRLLNSLTVERAVTRITQNSFACVNQIGAACAGRNACAETSVVFGANAHVQGESRNRRITEIDIATLIVSAQVARRNVGNFAIFHFILVAQGGREVFSDVGALRVDSGAVIFQDVVVAKRGIVIEAVLARVGLCAHDFVVPMSTSGKIPPKIGTEDFLSIALREIGWSEQRRSGNARAAGIVAQRQTDLIGVGEGVTKVPAEGAIEKLVVWPLSFG